MLFWCSVVLKLKQGTNREKPANGAERHATPKTAKIPRPAARLPSNIYGHGFRI
jgi:hypothetical protein